MEVGRNHTWLDGAVHSRSKMNVSPAIENPDYVAVNDLTRAGIIRADFEQTHLFHLLDHRHITKRRIQEVVRFTGEKLQRELRTLRTVARLVGRRKDCNRVMALRFQILTVKLSLPTLRPE